MTSSAQGTSVPSVFQFDSKEVRALDLDGEIWFVASDVCATLDLHATATRRLDNDEKGLRLMQTPSGEQQMLIINASGLYSLILRSRKPEAKRFKKWVTSEVLPAIRKTGRYEAASSELTKAQLKDAFQSARWLAQYQDGEIRFESIHPRAFLIKPESYIDVLRAPHIFPAVCLPDVLMACAERMEAICGTRRAAS